MVKLCIGCKYLRQGRLQDWCLHPESQYDHSIVNGEYRNKTAFYMREMCGKCGREAVLFEQKKPWWKLWLRNS